MPFTQSVGFVFDPNACLLYFEAGEFYHVSTFFYQITSGFEGVKENDEISVKLNFISPNLPTFLMTLYDYNNTNLKTLHAIYLDSNLNILIKDSIFSRPILSTPFPGSKIVFIFNMVFSFPLCDLLLDGDNELYLNKKKWFVPSFVDIYII